MAPSEMKTACLVNHFNYGRFIGEALSSVVAQTRALDEVVVVDDGSCDDDLAALRTAAESHDGVQVVEKENGGQLSCFEAGIEASSAEILFFLDADDTWEPNYVERVATLFGDDPKLGVVYTNECRVLADGTSEVTERPTRELGLGVARALHYGGGWHGQPTSCIAMRRSVVEQIFPLPLARGWKTCADEALVYGSALVGARRKFLGEPLVRYRIHDANHFHGREYDPADRLTRGIELLRLVEFLKTRESLPQSLAHIAHHEFRTIESPTRCEYKEYRRLVSGSALPGHRKRRVLIALWGWFRLGRRI